MDEHPSVPSIIMMRHRRSRWYKLQLRLLMASMIIVILSAFSNYKAAPKSVLNIYYFKNIHDLKTLPQTEILHNYTLNKAFFPEKVLISNNTFYDQYVLWDEKSLVIQHSLLQHYIFCDISRAGISTYGGYYYQPCPMYFHWDIYLNVSHSLQVYDKAVVGFCYHYQFGHVLQDMIGAILTVPSEILRDAHIFLRSDESQAKTYLSILGFPEERVHALLDEWIFVKDLYVAASNFGISGLQASFRDLHNLIYKVNNLTNIVPKLHIFINKDKDNWGYVHNMDELFNYTKMAYPQYEWVHLHHSIALNGPEMMKLIANTKVFVSGTGSTSFNMIFLHPNCGCLMIDSRYRNNPCIAIAHTLDIWFYYIASNYINRETEIKGGILDLDSFKKALEMVISATYNGRWPKITIPSRSFIDFDYNAIKQTIFNGINEDKTTVLQYQQKMKDNKITIHYPRLEEYIH